MGGERESDPAMAADSVVVNDGSDYSATEPSDGPVERTVEKSVETNEPGSMVVGLSGKIGHISNCGNSCYMSSVVWALFGGMDLYDALLVHHQQKELARLLRDHLREEIVNTMRRGHCVDKDHMDLMRNLCRANGWESESFSPTSGFECISRSIGDQQDACEFLLMLLETLESPVLPMMQVFHHGASRDVDDERMLVDRVLMIGLLQQNERRKTNNDHNNQSVVTLEELLWAHFFDNPISGLNRELSREVAAGDNSNKEKAAVNGWSTLIMENCYTRVNKPVCRLPSIIIPIVLKRFDGYGKDKRPVQVPETIDFSQFMSKPDVASNNCSNEFKLRLRSAVMHLGSDVGSGHYVAVVADGVDSWKVLDDTASILSRTRSTLKDTGIQKNGYIFFYELQQGSDYELAMQMDKEQRRKSCAVS